MKQIAKAYNHQEFEDAIYKEWEERGYFKPEVNPDGEPFCVIMPPPNANGSLHLGHAVFVTLEDLMTRFARLRGKSALWLPGADHAGFETQVVYEKKLEKEGRNRFEIPRDQLYKETFEFTQTNKKVMESQLKRLGASCDWSREKFTLDPDIIKIVYKTFKKLYDDGLAYRDVRPVNWCTKHQTSLSDLEVKFEEQTDPLYYIKYGPLTLATVRPETKFGDTAVAVNPNDKRYKEYVGKEIEIETVLGPAKIKVIADEYVDPKFGTGVVKITPAHDPNDFEVAKRHDLEIKEVIDQYGRLNEKAGPYKGMKILEARAKVVEDMQKKGLIEKIDENYVHQVGKCYKCGTVIEPRVIPQWFIAVNKKGKKSGKTLAKDALDAIKKGDVKFVTPKFEKIYKHWMNNIRDWNVSRQIVWGIRIPAWFKDIPLIGDLPEILKNGQEIKAGTEGSPVHAKKGVEYRFVASKTDIEWFQKNVKDKNEYSYTDFFDGENRTRVEDQKYSVTSKKAPRAGVVEKRGIAGSYEGNKVSLEERSTAGFARYEIEFKLQLPKEFEGREQISSTDIIEEIVAGKENQSVFVSDVAPLFDGWRQDSDVFDTWFSSGQWPFATLKTAKSGDFEKFYPTDVMETGWDILFFWVARMIMLGLYVTDKVPFKKVYLHGLVRDKDRQKMSKSKGNVIDPLGVADLYGPDAVRMALVFGTTAGNDAVVSEEKIKGMRNFSNKIWNASRFALLRSTGGDLQSGEIGQTQIENLAIDLKSLTDADKEILKKHQEIISKATKEIDSHQFAHAGETLYHYFWHEYCDVYIEEAKKQLDGGKSNENTSKILVRILSESLIMLHPFMPFVTEAVWQELRKVMPDMAESVMIAKWPEIK